MAEINNQQALNKKSGLVQKSKKKETRVDLTPMVDLGFLLITFFMFATTLAQPSVAKFRMPKDQGNPMPMPRQHTLIIIADSMSRYYSYAPITNEIVLEKKENIEAVRKSILQKKKSIGHYNVSVILKLHPKATYNNLIEMLDEMKINDISFYVVDKLDEKEKSILVNIQN